MYEADKLKYRGQKDLVKIANDEFGLGIAEGEDKVLIIDAILRAQSEHEQHLQETMTAGSDLMPTGGPGCADDDPEPVVDDFDPEEEVIIMIQETAAADGSFPFKGSLNGNSIVIHRGRKVAVKRKYLSLIDDCVETRYVQETDERTGKPTTSERQIPRFPYSFHGVVKKK